MVTKEERDRDRAIAERVETPLPWRWWTSNSIRRLSSDVTGKDGDVAHGTIYQGCPDIAIRERDMAHVENAVNRLQFYIDALDEMERRIEAAIKRESDAAIEYAITQDFAKADAALERASGLGEALGLLRGGQ